MHITHVITAVRGKAKLVGLREIELQLLIPCALLCPSIVPAAGLVVEGRGLHATNTEEKETHLTLALDWAMTRGSWGPEEFCPEGTFAYAFQIKVRMRC